MRLMNEIRSESWFRRSVREALSFEGLSIDLEESFLACLAIVTVIKTA